MTQDQVASGSIRPPVRVLQVLLWIVPAGGGIQTYLRALLHCLRHAPGVRLAGAALHPGLAPPNFNDRVLLGLAQARWRNTLRLTRNLLRQVREADVVHIHGVLHGVFVLAALVCLLRRVPFVVSSHGQLTRWYLDGGPTRRRWLARRVAMPLLRRSAAVIATTAWEEWEILRIIPRIRVATVPPAVVVPPERLAGPQGELRVVFVGQFNRQKGLPVLIEAVARLHEQGIPARLTLVGAATEAGFESKLRDLIQERRLDRYAEFAGYLEGADKWNALAAAHVFALPSEMENFSFATAEALCAGVPVVVSTEVGLAAVVQNHGCGSVVPPGDASALAMALARYADPAFRQASAALARHCAEVEFAPALMRERLLSLYTSIGRQQG